MRHVGEEIRFCLAGLLELLVQSLQLMRPATLALGETLQLPAHVVHMVGQRAEFIAIGDVNRGTKVSLRHLAEEAMGLLNRQDKGP